MFENIYVRVGLIGGALALALIALTGCDYAPTEAVKCEPRIVTFYSMSVTGKGVNMSPSVANMCIISIAELKRGDVK